ncbi:DUF2878 domain-containing protein [Pseudoxanthomonas dokdonensis]|uniref:DUF2878 domain-containing protein n=1 Tax=Pseudoxanthomonas dokdonensis TaxID=344882 RepID=A0A0R0CM18_9GAMM|nr:DUF2878 domain-containing protein [Pseudoxanthomonas dokdonensis]KRG70592.1 hypothetical protein ABB29_05890 [Pseudoxanthomonas dokdonensis]
MHRFWINLLGNQLVWLCAVIGAGRGLQWPALLAAALYIASQLAGAPRPRVELRLLWLALACGAVVDGVAAGSGLVVYAASVPGPLPPPWILALWAAFAMTLTTSMAFLQRRAWLASLFGLLLAPLAYLSAARGWDAVQFAAPTWRGILLLGIGWALVLPLLAAAARRWSRTAPPALDTADAHP